MAKFYWHDFIPSFSGVVLVTFIALIVTAFVTGYRSVRVRPRKVGGTKLDPEAPRFKSRKAALVRENFKRGLARKKDLADSVIVFRSVTMDVIWALGAGVVFVSVLVNEHWYGIVQFWINDLAANEDAAWGDIMAFMTVAILGGLVTSVFCAVSEYGQWLHASKLVERYLYKLNVRPIIKETPHVIFIAQALVWAIKTMIEERRIKRRIAAIEKRSRITMTSANEKKPIDCKVIEFDCRAI